MHRIAIIRHDASAVKMKSLAAISRLLLIPLLSVTESLSDCVEDGTCNEETDDDTCTLYMAPSSLRALKAFGIFTVKPFKKGSLLLPTDCPGIPMIDCAFNFKPHDNGFLHSYSWFHGHSQDADYEAFEVGEFAVTFHALPNHHGYLAALDPYTARPSYDDTVVNRSTDPEAGAFSYHRGRDFFTYRDLEAGDEIFLDYGVHEVEDGNELDGRYAWVSDVPGPEDWELAGILLKKSWDLVQFIRSNSNENRTLGTYFVSKLTRNKQDY